MLPSSSHVIEGIRRFPRTQRLPEGLRDQLTRERAFHVERIARIDALLAVPPQPVLGDECACEDCRRAAS